MTGETIFQMFAYLLPAVVTGVVAFYFFKMHTKCVTICFRVGAIMTPTFF